MFWKGVVIGFLAAVSLLIIGAYCYFGSGLRPLRRHHRSCHSRNSWPIVHCTR